MQTNIANLRLTSGRLYWRPRGADGYIDFGNVSGHKPEPERNRVQHYRSRNGKKTLDLMLLKSSKEKWVFTLDEHFTETIKLLTVGTQIASTVQAALLLQTLPVYHLPTLGRAYDLGARALTRVKVETDGPIVTEDTDYALDAAAGYITFYNAVVTDWTITIDQPLLTTLNFKAFGALLQRGDFIFCEQDQLDDTPINRETFAGQVYVQGWGNNDGEKFNEFTLEILYTP